MHFVKNIVLLLLCFNVVIDLTIASLPSSIYEQKKYKRHIEEQVVDGLYDNSDYVINLRSSNLKKRVFDQPHASLVEFYNSFCGFCRRFAPTWKEIAEEILGWRSIVLVTAIDCSKDENNNICREFEVMAYPTIRYFSPFYTDGAQKIGVQLKGHSKEEIMSQLLHNLEHTLTTPDIWPSLAVFNDTDKTKLFKNNKKAKYAFLINENENTSSVAIEVILDFFGFTEVVVKRTRETYEKSEVTVIEAGTLDTTKLPINKYTRQRITKMIKDYLKNYDIIFPDVSTKSTVENISQSTNESNISSVMKKKQEEAMQDKVKKMNGVVFQADLEETLKYSLFHEVTKFQKIDGERLSALQRYLNVLIRYFPFNENGIRFLKELQHYVMNVDIEIQGDKFADVLKTYEENRKPVFSSNRWIGCNSNQEGLRKFPCGLWTLFHYLTVQAADTDVSTDTLEILHAMYGYVKYFFGCSDCSQHFQQMATGNKIWNVTSKDDAVLWLWSSHNEVNKRLAGDLTEDSDFPKIQFPSAVMCPSCRKKILSNHHNHQQYPLDDSKSGDEWDLTNILTYLKSVYSYENRNFLGLNEETIAPQKLSYISEIGDMQSNRIFGNVLNDLDLRMGILLYAICIVMMFVAVKLVVKRGYKKKMYAHDILGKV